MIEAVHAYIAEIPASITAVEFSKIGMESYKPTWENGEQEEEAVKGAIAYIQKNGEREAKRLSELLRTVQSSVIKLRSLTAKGQVFNFKDYVKCQNAVAMLTWHFDRMEAFMAIIGSPTFNWEHPEVVKQLKNVMAIDPNDIRRSLAENNIVILEFARKTYKRIYG